MKKLITIIMILALTLPALALADDPMYIDKHYSLFINSHDGQFVSGKGGRIFTFDSYTADLFLSSDGKTGYLIETTYVDGIFLNNGMSKVSLVEIGNKTALVYENGDNIEIERDENGRDLWMKMSRGFFRMRLVDPVDASEDWRP